jgi:hypothetical protein
MARKHSPRVKELANKIGGGTDVDPTQIDAVAVKNAHTAGSIDDGERDEFMKSLQELAGGDDELDD